MTALRHTGRRHHGVAGAVGAGIGFYDGILGPGTGSFLVFAMGSLLGYDFLAASAKAKIVNVATNLGALLFSVPHGSVFWGLGILLGAANPLGGHVGSRTATSLGSGFIRVAFLVVVTVLVTRVGWDVWTEKPGPSSGDPARRSSSAQVSAVTRSGHARLPCRRPGTDPGPGVVHEETE